MGKIYLEVKMSIIVDTDINDVDDIMDYVDCYASGDDYNVSVLEHEVTDYSVEDVK